jgi:hypothetical protein
MKEFLISSKFYIIVWLIFLLAVIVETYLLIMCTGETEIVLMAGIIVAGIVTFACGLPCILNYVHTHKFDKDEK